MDSGLNKSEGTVSSWDDIDAQPLEIKYLENYGSVEMAERYKSGYYNGISHMVRVVSNEPDNPTFKEFCEGQK